MFYDMVPLGLGVELERHPMRRGSGPVEFILRYSGRLQCNDKDDKQEVRRQVSRQLEELCKANEFFADCRRPDLLTATYKGDQLIFDHDPNHPADRVAFCRVPLGGFEFVPLIHRAFYLACQLDVTWLRKEKPGRILANGDIDNRLKTLFDGLRMPHHVNELGGVTPDVPGQRLYCLMDDDSLVSKLSVSTHQLLEAADPLNQSDQRGNTVELLIKVTVLITSRRKGNIGVGQLV